jgi:hypothetical protein
VLLVATTSFGDFLIRTGAIAGGSIAIGGSIGLVVGAITRDLGVELNQWDLGQKGAALGGLFGVVFGVLDYLL